MTDRAAGRWPADLTDGLKRLKLAAMRRLAPELLVTAKTQRWSPEELLRTLVEAEIAARDASNARHPPPPGRVPGHQDPRRVRPAPRPRSRQPRSTTSPRLEWIRAAENVCLIGPAGTGKSHLLLALGSAAVDAGHRVRYFTAADLVDTLYRGLADNTVGTVIDTLLRNDLIICRRARVRPAGRHRRPAAVPVRRRRLRTPQPSASAHTGPSKPGAGSCPNTPPPSAMLDRLLHHATSSSPTASPTACAKPDNEEEPRSTNPETTTRSGDFYLATSDSTTSTHIPTAADRRGRPPLLIRLPPTQTGSSKRHSEMRGG